MSIPALEFFGRPHHDRMSDITPFDLVGADQTFAMGAVFLDYNHDLIAYRVSVWVRPG
jgi:hypothetical protein